MAKDVQKDSESKKEQVKANKESSLLSFNVWFSDVINRRKDVKAHHMSAIKAHFKSIGLGEIERPEDFNEGLKHYGL
jgi:hypothetical protein